MNSPQPGKPTKPLMPSYLYGQDCGICGKWYLSNDWWHRIFEGHWPHPMTFEEWKQRQ